MHPGGTCCSPRKAGLFEKEVISFALFLQHSVIFYLAHQDLAIQGLEDPVA
jgi:hypothetical protein